MRRRAVLTRPLPGAHPRALLATSLAICTAAVAGALWLAASAPWSVTAALATVGAVASSAVITLRGIDADDRELVLSTMLVLPAIVVAGPSAALPGLLLGVLVAAAFSDSPSWAATTFQFASSALPILGAAALAILLQSATADAERAAVFAAAAVGWLLGDLGYLMIEVVLGDGRAPTPSILADEIGVSRSVSWLVEYSVAAAVASLWYVEPILSLTVIVPVAIGVVMTTRKVESDAQNAFLTDTFQRYVPQRMVEALLESGADLDLGGTEVEISVLFCDIRGFTGWSESLPARQVVDELNVLLGDLAAQVTATGGTLDKFTGDGLMAFWGAPLAQPDHAERAVLCATRMARAMDERNAMRAQRGLPPLMVGIGIHSGTAIVGAIGTEERHDFTAIGDTVNVAARLEASTKDLAAIAIISYQTFLRLPPAMQHQCPAPLAVSLKGRAQPVPAHVLIPMPPQLRATYLPPAA